MATQGYYKWHNLTKRIRCNNGPILYHFRDKARNWLKIAIFFHTFFYITTPWGKLLRILLHLFYNRATSVAYRCLNKKCGRRVWPTRYAPPASNDTGIALGQDDSDWSRDLATLTFDLGGHGACGWCGSSSSIRTRSLKFVGLAIRKIWRMICHH